MYVSRCAILQILGEGSKSLTYMYIYALFICTNVQGYRLTHLHRITIFAIERERTLSSHRTQNKEIIQNIE